MKLSTLSLCMFGLYAASASLNSVADSSYYNPANKASSSGQTTGYELYKTIGCPGRGLLEPPCQGPAEPAPKAEAKPEPAAKPAPVIDTDADGVPDAADTCPGTAAMAKVDAKGCELDGDGDGVVDRLDLCPTTPPGRTVDAKGCELDGDGDRVVDALDQCPTTPPGRVVNDKGCELDGDGDGVVDALDQCPTTPPGRAVDAKGCELDADQDGVLDSVDQCLGTPAGERVDTRGCTLPKVMVLEGVNFDNNKADIRADAKPRLDEAVVFLKANPSVNVEVGGHTDSTNTDWYNLWLGGSRAKAVMRYFVEQGIDPARLSAKSYGESQPIADNATQEGRLKNRRVELKVMN